MPKVRLLHIITRMDRGGSSQVTLSTVSRLDKKRFDVTLMSGSLNDPDKEILNILENSGVRLILIPDLVRDISLLKDVKALWRIHRFISKEGFDIVHTQTSKAGFLGRWAAKLAGVRIIIHAPHGHVFYGYFGWCKSRLIIFLEKLTALITDKIITLTQKGKDDHVLYGIAKPDKFIPIHNGINLEEFTDSGKDMVGEKKKLGLPLDCPVIGTVTRFEPVKANRYFIDSLPRVVEKFPNIKVLLAGEGSQRRDLQRRVENLSLSNNVIFMGMRKDIPQVLRVMDLFVLSSLNEGLGICLLEAQAMGLPVVATAVGGVPEVVKDGITGILVNARDPKALAEAIIKILDDNSLRRHMSEEAKKFVKDKFSLEQMIEKISRLYEELLTKKG
ncbi:MAG: glycosyltransferase family 4 protein [Candidatus Omnitrophica bacterium]|nr:glycosyltransferase family 4 protein [Candidatus Omnitrophota bacterium]